jgi:hypothetical protein
MSNFKWIPIDPDRARLLREALGDMLENGYGQLTDLSGQYGSPKIIDTWGIKGADLPLLKATTLLGGPKDEIGCYYERLETKWLLAVHLEDRDDPAIG